jgi:hypothetical protein
MGTDSIEVKSVDEQERPPAISRDAMANPQAEREHELKKKEMELEAGALGKFFGSSKNAPQNIAGLIGVMLVLSGLVAVFKPVEGVKPDEFWKIISPLIAGVLGYLFGRKN